MPDRVPNQDFFGRQRSRCGGAEAVAHNTLLYCVGGTDDGRLGFGNFFNNVQIYQP
jgi:hypothetical protein